MGGSVLQTFQGCSPVMDVELLVDDVAGQDHGSMDDGWGSMSSSDDSIVSSSTLDFSDDDGGGDMSSSSSSSMTLHPSPEVDSNGPLCELSQLMVHPSPMKLLYEFLNSCCWGFLTASQQLPHYLLEFPVRFETCRILRQGASVISSWRQRLELSDINHYRGQEFSDIL